MTTPIFLRAGSYWGFIARDKLYDRYGRHVGWLEGVDVYDRSGRYLGELLDGHYVLRSVFQPEPVHRARWPAVPYPTPPDPLPAREPRLPTDGWREVLPWPLDPPEPLTV